MQIECSELAWEMSVTETPAPFSDANRRSAVPGTPIMPEPSRLTSAMPPIAVMPLIPLTDSTFAQMRLPAWAGLWLLRMRTGMSRLITGPMVWG